MDFIVDVDSRGNYSVVRVFGEVDLYTSPVLDSCLSDLVLSQKTQIAVDLSDCTYFDSDGIKILVRYARKVQGEGRFVICGASGAVSRAFRVCGLESVIPMFPSIGAVTGL